MLPPTLTDRQARFLAALRIHPLLSLEQIQMVLGWCVRRVQVYLTQLRQMGLIASIKPRHPNIAAHSLWMLTAAGVNALHAHIFLSDSRDLENIRYTRARSEWLLLRLERVYHIRTFLLNLQRKHWEWSLQSWDVEVEAQFYKEDELNRYYHANLPGIAQLKNAQGRWVNLAVEYDVNLMPVRGERARLDQFINRSIVSGFNDPWKYNFPICVIIAANRERMRDYYHLLFELGNRQGLMPWMVFTTRDDLSAFYADPTADVWHSDLSQDGECVPLLYGIAGAEKRTNQLDWQPLPCRQSANEKHLELKPLAPGTMLTHSRHDLAAITLALFALDKQILNWIADHPLLDAAELAFIAQMPVRSIRRSLNRLRKWKLIKAYAYHRLSDPMCCVLTDKGIWLLTAWAGLGTAIKTYAHLRGWDHGFGGIIKHWHHTRLENRINLEFLREAREREHTLVGWHSELESQLYSPKVKLAPHFRSRPSSERDIERSEIVGGDSIPSLDEYGQNMARFLPDGSGVYDTGDARYTIAVEVDRSKANMQKMQGKLDYYSFAVGQDDNVTWRILFVTTGWQRARHLADLVLRDSFNTLRDDSFQNLRGDALVKAIKQQDRFDLWLSRILPVFITTVDALKGHGIAGKIWMNVWNAIYPKRDSRVHCLECFESHASQSQANSERAYRQNSAIEC